MFGIGAGEFVVIAIVLLIAVGPARLPGLMRNFGKALRQVKRMTHEFREASGIDELLAEADPNLPVRRPAAPTLPAVLPAKEAGAERLASQPPPAPLPTAAATATPVPTDVETTRIAAAAPTAVEDATTEVHIESDDPTIEVHLQSKRPSGTGDDNL